MTGKELRSERRRLKVSQEELCEAAELSWEALTSIETESVVPETPTIDGLYRITREIAAARLGVPS